VGASLKVAGFVLACLLLPALPISAQLRVGDLSTSLSGTIAPGYSADYGNQTSSDHSWALGGSASLTGSFYNPNFLSFNVGLYLNQSRANSNFQSISDASGVNASVNLFSGTHFPGSVNYSKTFNSEGNYSVPGLANYVTHGNSDTFGINWSESVPGKPNFSAGFQFGGSQYSIYGTNDLGNNQFHSVSLHSGYSVAGFNLGGYYTDGGSHSLIPQVVSGEQSTETHSTNSGTGFTVSHVLPFQGIASGGFNRSSWNTNYLTQTSTGTVDTLNTLVSMRPGAKVSMTGSLNYSDNLSGQLTEQLVSAGAIVPDITDNETSNSLDLLGDIGYVPFDNVQTNAYVERRTQNYLGSNYGVTSYGASATVSDKLLGGNLNASVNVALNSADQSGSQTVGFSANESYSTLVRGWQVSETFSYSQNAQTLLVTYMNSFYNYSANARRHWGEFSVSAGAGAGRTGLTQQPGTDNSSENYFASIGYGAWITTTGTYSRANGQAIATGSGLVTVPIPPPTLPSDLVSIFGGDSYSVGLSSSPVKKLILAASYAKSISNNSNDAVVTANQNNEFSSLVQYQYRKLSFNSGFARLEQGFSGSDTAPQVISSFYIGVSRWFNFF